ncbi:MAG TPA: hypothetical protein PLO62_02245 [Candidatus Hydrogenedentes bacterium]|nr:hypothetical protein [Candidatus Hydrogenedentota bacterium]HOS02535.1 hypothetical protein [Candidatus Hydrogenedentota bacterium]
MLRTLLTAVGGVVLLALFFLAVQLFIRKHTPGIGPECDLLEDRVHGCHQCDKIASCSLRDDSETHADAPPRPR